MNQEPLLRVSIAGIKLLHPIMNASGFLGYSREHIRRLTSYGFSAVVTKTITPYPKKGYEPPIIIALPNGGLLNAVGLENPGKECIKEMVEEAKKLGIPIIVSVGGSTEEEFVEVAEEAELRGATAIELNLSCPHAKGYGIEIGIDPQKVFSVVKNVVSVTKIPVIAKLGLSDKVLESAGKALEAGATGLTLINTIKAMAIDIYSLKPILTNIFGGLSGPPIHPIAVRIVYEVYKEYKADIIGCGGVSKWEDIAEFVVAGAKAVEVGTAIIFSPASHKFVEEMLIGLRNWLKMLGFKSIEETIGVAHKV
ncbi:MAG: dihydroorotate dehydrogenase PyrD [Ignisphaera sp.]